MALNMTEGNVVMGDPLEPTIDFGLGELQLLLLKTHEDKVVQVDAQTGETLTASLALHRAIRLAQWMLANGVRPGDAVTVNSENRLEFCIVPMALFFIGAVYAPLNPDYSPDELVHVLNLSKPKMAFCSRSRLTTMKNMMQKLPYIQKLVVFGKRRLSEKNVVMYQRIIKGVIDGPIDDSFESFKTDPQSVAMVLCSSGTTGLPKGVMTTHANVTTYIDIARVFRARFADMLEEKIYPIVTFGITPFYHSMGFMTMYLNLLVGTTMVVMRKFRANLFLAAIEKYKVTTMAVPPPIVLLLLRHPSVSKYDLNSLRDVRCGAAPMGKELEGELAQKFKLDHVSQAYGMTETTLGLMTNTYNTTRIGSVGQVVPGMMCKIIDENGNALGPNQEGELCAKGPLIMKGYIGDEVATRSTVDGDGWLHTGDVAYFDRDGFFYIVDRLKELIKYKGFQVAPAELEALLLLHPAVADAAVTSIPDAVAGELPLAFVVRKEGVKVSEKQIQDYVAGKVSRQKHLRGGVRFIESIPKNPSGKILRRVLKEQAKATVSKL